MYTNSSTVLYIWRKNNRKTVSDIKQWDLSMRKFGAMCCVPFYYVHLYIYIAFKMNLYTLFAYWKPLLVLLYERTLYNSNSHGKSEIVRVMEWLVMENWIEWTVVTRLGLYRQLLFQFFLGYWKAQSFGSNYWCGLL